MLTGTPVPGLSGHVSTGIASLQGAAGDFGGCWCPVAEGQGCDMGPGVRLHMEGEGTCSAVLSSISGSRISANSTHFFATPLETRKAYYVPLFFLATPQELIEFGL